MLDWLKSSNKPKNNAPAEKIESQPEKEILSGVAFGELLFYSFMFSQGNGHFQASIYSYLAESGCPTITNTTISDFEKELKDPESATGRRFSRFITNHHEPKKILMKSHPNTNIPPIMEEAKKFQDISREHTTTSSMEAQEKRVRDIATQILQRDVRFWFGEDGRQPRKRSQFVEHIVRGINSSFPDIYQTLFAIAKKSLKDHPLLITPGTAVKAGVIFDNYNNKSAFETEKILYSITPTDKDYLVELRFLNLPNSPQPTHP